MDATDIVRQQLSLRLFYGLLQVLLLNMRKTAIIHIPLCVILLRRNQLLRLVDLYEISLVPIDQRMLVGGKLALIIRPSSISITINDCQLLVASEGPLNTQL